MNDKTLDQELENDSKRTTSTISYDEVVRDVQPEQYIEFIGRTVRVTGKRYQEREDGTFHIQLSSRPE